MQFDPWVFAPAKVNLALHVTGQRDDGYHLLDSFVVFASDVGDRLRLEPGSALSLEVSGPFSSGVPTDSRNILWKAAELAGWSGHIQLEKNLPHGGGIGGGSSDAAAFLSAVGALDTGLSLGADVPVCRVAQAARMSGIGDLVETVKPPSPPLPAVLVNPGIQLATASVFAELNSKSNPPISAFAPTEQELFVWIAKQRNDLEVPAITLEPVIADVLKELRLSDGVVLARMSGSGSTCFGLFPTELQARQAAHRIAASHPDWWVKATSLA